MSIILRDVLKVYRRGRQSVEVFKSLSLNIWEGEFVSLMGPSGSGKTTLLNMLGGIEHADLGEVTVCGDRLDRLSHSALASWRAMHVGFVFQFYNLMHSTSVERNVELPLFLTGLNRTERTSRVASVLELVGLERYASCKPSELSGGQQQCVGIARALVADPPILLCDEPTGDLDRESAAKILSILSELNTCYKKTIVMVTHDKSAAKYSSRTVLLDKGEIVNLGASS